MRIAYAYSGLDQLNRQVNGVIIAQSKEEAEDMLRELGIRIEEIEVDPIKTLANLRSKTLSAYELKDLMFAFYNAQRSALSIRMIVDSLPDMFTGYARKVAEDIRIMIKEKGYQLSIVFKKAGLPDFIVHAVEAAEIGGDLEEVLGKIVKILEVMAKSESELKKALIYPKIVLAMVVGVVFTIIWQVMPRLQSVYQDATGVPDVTKFLLHLGHYIDTHRTESILFILGMEIALWFAISTKTFLNFVAALHVMGEKSPTLKKLTRKFSEFLDSYETMKICFFLDLLYTAGIKPNLIVSHIKDIVDVRGTKKKLDVVKSHIENGLPIYKSFELAGFDKQLVGFIRAGEDQNSLSFYMKALAEYKERSFENSIERIKVILPMLLMIVAAGAVVFLMIYIIAPLYNIAG